jgi:hypothetical protein
MIEQTTPAKAYRARLVAKGGRRVPGGFLQPGDARILNALLAVGYEETPQAVMVKALRVVYSLVIAKGYGE